LPDLSQGYLKKIEFNLLLADLAFKLAYSLLRSSKLISFNQRLERVRLARAMR
jgi:hypothetical protein